jgi:hypothetical protein
MGYKKSSMYLGWHFLLIHVQEIFHMIFEREELQLFHVSINCQSRVIAQQIIEEPGIGFHFGLRLVAVL